MRSIKVVKIGGNVINKPEKLDAFLADFARIEGPKMLVHGGGREATRLCEVLGIPTTMIDGRRVTDRKTLDVVTMVYAGLINKTIVAKLQALGCDAIGLSGADANIIKAIRRPAEPIDYGFVGDIDLANVTESDIAHMLRFELTPVFCSITHDGNGTLLNCNADTVASSLACAVSRIQSVRLIYCFEKRGVLSNPDDDDSVIPSVTSENYPQLRADGVISGGMIPKIDNAFAAIDGGVKSVTIKSADELLDPSAGTTITA